jgi:hypothetical protein
MAHRSLVLGIAVSALLAACGGDDGGSAGVPAAPTTLTGSVLSGGAHLTWKDNSDNETGFMIMRMEVGGAGYASVATPTFNTTTYHDAPLTAGKTYMYMVHAVNEAGESDPSNEVMVAIP